MQKKLSTLKYILKKYNLVYHGKNTQPIKVPNITRNNLAELIRELDFKRAVEVGVAAGEYSEILCKTNPQMKIYGVDPWTPYTGYTDYVKTSTFTSLYRTAVKRLAPYKNYEFVKEFSIDALKRFKDNSLDFVYIDANHKEPYISQDITEWYRKIKVGGILAGHDYTEKKTPKVDVTMAVSRFTKKNHIETWFVLGSGDEELSWMIVKQKSQFPRRKVNRSMLGKWDSWYKNVKQMSSFRYGNTITYQLSEDFLTGLEVEDWGCGTGGFKRIHQGKYVGIDGSYTPFVDKVADLRIYKSSAEAILLRHVLEHNIDWKKVLDNAISSFKKRLAVVIFTPFADKTKVIAQNKKHGVDVPDISFNKADIESHFKGLKWDLKENIKTKTAYGVEHIYYVERPKIAMITANLGGFDKMEPHIKQSISYDYYLFTDENFLPRTGSMTPRLQAKIPKFFAWQMVPDYDYYFYLDANFVLTSPDSLKYFFDNCQNFDIVVLKHPRRNTVKWEARYLERGLQQGSRYIAGRYTGEFLSEQMAEINSDPYFVDDLLVNGGVFIYKNTPLVQKMLKEWWYFNSRYLVMDQCSFAYVLKKSGLKVNVLPDSYIDSPYLRHKGHVYHY